MINFKVRLKRSTLSVDGNMFVGFILSGGRVLGGVISLLGVVGNILCFRVVDDLPHSSSAFILKYLSVWDTLSASAHGSLMLYGIKLQDFGVSKTPTFKIIKKQWESLKENGGLNG